MGKRESVTIKYKQLRWLGQSIDDVFEASGLVELIGLDCFGFVVLLLLPPPLFLLLVLICGAGWKEAEKGT